MTANPKPEVEVGLKWPGHFPKGCPPSTAQKPAGTYYRFVKNEPHESDFISNYARFPAKAFGDICQACGLSMYEKESDIREAQKRVLGMSKKKIAVGSLDDAPGVIHPTPRDDYQSHFTWWLPDSADSTLVMGIFGLIK